MNIIIADVSHHNTVNYFDAYYIDGVIIRASYGENGKDKKLDEHVKKAELAGIPYGFYHFSYATTEDSARKNADNFIKSIARYNPTLPCAIDMENDTSNKDLSTFWKFENRKAITKIGKIQLEALEESGYYAMIYGNTWDLENITSDKALRDRYGLWVAKWTDKAPTTNDMAYYPTLKLWQNTCKGNVPGIVGDVDLSVGETSFLTLVSKMHAQKAPTENNVSRETIKPGDKVMCHTEIDIYGTHLADYVRKLPCEVISYRPESDAFVISLDGKTPTAVVPGYTLERV